MSGTVGCDVAVVGYGAAGCAAAIAAHDTGADVVVLEKTSPDRAGGNTRVSGGIWFQSRDAASAARYLRSLSGGFPLPEPVVAAWAEATHHNSDWLRGLGVDVAPHPDHFASAEYPELDGSDTYVAGMGVGGVMGDQALWDALVRLVGDRGIPVVHEARAERLVHDGRRVVGVVGTVAGAPMKVTARRGVVLATGGFEASEAMVREFLPLAESAVSGSRSGTGDGIRMAQRLGADLWHMTNRSGSIGIAVAGFEAGFPVTFPYSWSWIWVGPDGRRFTDESLYSRHGHVHIHGTYEYRTSTHPTYVVFDEATRLAGPVGPTREKVAVGWNVLMARYVWSADNSSEIEQGWIVRGDDPADLAGRLGLADPDALGATIDGYNAACGAGTDPFGRDPATRVPLGTGPIYGFRSVPVIGWTNGGLRHDERGRVLDVDGGAIDGLYAAGSVSSTYGWCKDAGFHIADALAFGRVAGRESARAAPGEVPPPTAG
ncbi:MAG TPA: FAD-dependent oxidoreductase [Acidimicrobiales bacterium]|nr:FAD-dependent oxidoreductase [Acidimicrobiales bacterium]